MPAYEGAIEDISSNQLDYISSVLDKHGYGDAKVTVNPVGDAGDNYAAKVKRFIAEKEGETFKMIVKVAPTNEQMRKSSNTVNMFKNEYFMYDKVLPKFTELEIAAGIPENDRLRYATFHGGFLEEPLELILLEDLQEPGFVMLDRFKSLTNDTIKLVLKAFARLHSLSYALKHQEPETFVEFKSNLFNSWEVMSQDPNATYFFGVIENETYDLLESEKHKKAVKGTLSKIAELLLGLYKYDYESRYCVIQQGDSWTNNIMFKMEGESPTECCMIDYQLSKANSPVSDLHYMIFNCTDHKTRAKHFNDWIDYYHAELGKSLFEFGLKADFWYPRDQLDADLKRHGKASLALTVLLSSVLSRQAGEAEKLKELMQEGNLEKAIEESRMVETNPETTKIFKAKVEGAIDTMIDFGLL